MSSEKRADNFLIQGKAMPVLAINGTDVRMQPRPQSVVGRKQVVRIVVRAPSAAIARRRAVGDPTERRVRGPAAGKLSLMHPMIRPGAGFGPTQGPEQGPTHHAKGAHAPSLCSLTQEQVGGLR
eukprot:6191258-Prymnesium_polylepis.1